MKSTMKLLNIAYLGILMVGVIMILLLNLLRDSVLALFVQRKKLSMRSNRQTKPKQH